MKAQIKAVFMRVRTVSEYYFGLLKARGQKMALLLRSINPMGNLDSCRSFRLAFNTSLTRVDSKIQVNSSRRHVNDKSGRKGRGDVTLDLSGRGNQLQLVLVLVRKNSHADCAD